jgi:hypothetical protein
MTDCLTYLALCLGSSSGSSRTFSLLSRNPFWKAPLKNGTRSQRRCSGRTQSALSGPTWTLTIGGPFVSVGLDAWKYLWTVSTCHKYGKKKSYSLIGFINLFSFLDGAIVRVRKVNGWYWSRSEASTKLYCHKRSQCREDVFPHDIYLQSRVRKYTLVGACEGETMEKYVCCLRCSGWGK